MVQNNDRAELVDALKCLRDNDIAHLPQNQKDILLNADEKALIQAYYDMDGEFSYTATDKICIEGLIQQLCSAKKMRHPNNLNANHHLSNSGNIHIQ